MESSSKAAGKASGKAPKSPESFESLNLRNRAAEILQSYEQLSWYSFQRCESMAQTRQHFENIVAGFTEEDEAALADWKSDNTPRPPKDGEQEKHGRKKGKKRMSSGGGDGVASASAQKAGRS